MIIKYKKNKEEACYDTSSLVTDSEPRAAEHPHGPFESCGDCSYAGPGFFCYGKEGDCIRTYLNKINQKKKEGRHV